MRLLKIGRDASCNIVLHSEKVSSLHAELTLLNSGDITIEDKGSRNGTFIMNQRIKPNTPVNVRRGDAIRFADVELQWSQVPMPEDNSAYRAIYGIGSHFNNDFQISGATVSRYHATVKQGRDGKFYIFDHSKNGTTVDGVKISPNSPYRIKKKSSVVCGGVPVDLSRLDWPGDMWKYIAGIAASLVLIAGIGFGLWKLLDGPRTIGDQELYARYNNSVVMLKGIYHFELSIGDLDLDKFNKEIALVQTLTDNENLFSMSPKWLYAGSRYIPLGDLSKKDMVAALDEITDDKGMYNGTGFFISKDGILATNLHVVKPWLEEDLDKELEKEIQRRFAYDVEYLNKYINVGYSAYISQVKVKGVLDYIALVPQGEIFDKENIRECRAYSAGDDLKKDVALIKMVSSTMPQNFTWVNVQDSVDISDEALTVGNHVVTFGFPHSHSLQKDLEDKGIKAFCHPGTISRQPDDFGFYFTSNSAGGASGSPIFNEYGMLIGVLNSGYEKENITFGIKAKYIKELLENPILK